MHRITLTPSNANPGETLYIEIPKLTDNMVIVPGSVFLVFNLAISGHENNTVVNNISRNLVKRQRVVFGGETLQDTTKLWSISNISRSLSPKKKSAKICWDTEYHLKICGNSELMPATRTPTTQKKLPWQRCITQNIIPLDHPILTDHGVFYPKSLTHPLKFEISLAQVRDVVVFSDDTKSPTYAITNLELEYRCISSKFLAEKAQAAYKTNHAFFYENILHHKTFTFSNQMTALLMSKSMSQEGQWQDTITFYWKPNSRRQRFWKICKSNIKSFNINIDGVPNMFIFQDLLPTDQWESIKQRSREVWIRSYRNKILHRRQVCFVDRSQESRG